MAASAITGDPPPPLPDSPRSLLTRREPVTQVWRSAALPRAKRKHQVKVTSSAITGASPSPPLPDFTRSLLTRREPVTQVWQPIAVLIFIDSPWLVWVLTFIYSCAKACCISGGDGGDRQIPKRQITRNASASISAAGSYM